MTAASPPPGCEIETSLDGSSRQADGMHGPPMAWKVPGRAGGGGDEEVKKMKKRKRKWGKKWGREGRGRSVNPVKPTKKIRYDRNIEMVKYKRKSIDKRSFCDECLCNNLKKTSETKGTIRLLLMGHAFNLHSAKKTKKSKSPKWNRFVFI